MAKVGELEHGIRRIAKANKHISLAVPIHQWQTRAMPSLLHAAGALCIREADAWTALNAKIAKGSGQEYSRPMGAGGRKLT